MKKIKLSFKNTDYSDEYKIIGICSHLKDYRISWNINKELNLKFVKKKGLKLNSSKQNKAQYNEFSFYFFHDKTNHTIYYLISNRNPNGILIPEQKHIDYFLLINGYVNKQCIDKYIKTIKNIDNILTVYTINLGAIKDINNILSDIELHTL